MDLRPDPNNSQRQYLKFTTGEEVAHGNRVRSMAIRAMVYFGMLDDWPSIDYIRPLPGAVEDDETGFMVPCETVNSVRNRKLFKAASRLLRQSFHSNNWGLHNREIERSFASDINSYFGDPDYEPSAQVTPLAETVPNIPDEGSSPDLAVLE